MPILKLIKDEGEDIFNIYYRYTFLIIFTLYIVKIS